MTSRRTLLHGVAVLTTLPIAHAALAAATRAAKSERAHEAPEEAVSATEDLMREHGVLRRALLVYTEAATRLEQAPSDLARFAEPLQKTARLFRTFGEDYHERRLEETYIFPVVKKAGGPAASYPDVLKTQHERGREITDYIVSTTKDGDVASGAAPSLARAMNALVRMYRNHAAREDTIVFPAWKKALSRARLAELSETFEDIEHQLFGKDGFEDAVRQIGAIETSLGFADLAQFTAPPPPRPS